MATPKASGYLRITGDTQIATFCKEFTNKFPYLHIRIFEHYGRYYVGKKPVYEGSFTSVRTRNHSSTGNTVTIAGNRKVITLIEDIYKSFGLDAEVCFYELSGKAYYTNPKQDEMTLSALNEYCGKYLCDEGKWK